MITLETKLTSEFELIKTILISKDYSGEILFQLEFETHHVAL